MSRGRRSRHAGTMFVFSLVTAQVNRSSLAETRRHLRMVVDPLLTMSFVVADACEGVVTVTIIDCVAPTSRVDYG